MSKPAFLSGGGAMGRLIREMNWERTSLGPPESWPQSLKTALRILLSTRHPMYIWWGPELLCFYNDAYSASIGPERHPSSLGQPGQEVWQEIWPIIGPQIEQVMEGRGATWNENQLVPITRHGRREEVYWTYSYGPIDDHEAPNGVGGVLVVCTETTKQVQFALSREEEVKRLDRMFEQAPVAIAVLRGPDHEFELANPGYRKLVGNRDVVGKRVAEALPEVVGQHYIELLDHVYHTGQPHAGRNVTVSLKQPHTGLLEERRVDFVYQPLTDEAGQVNGIFVAATDYTERYRAEEDLRNSEGQLRFLDHLNDITQALLDPTEIMTATAGTLAEHLGAAVCAYADMEEDEDGFTIRGDWTKPGASSIVGSYRLSDFGATAVSLLRAGRPLVTCDTLVELGPREADVFLRLGLKATVCMPLVKNCRLTALMAVHSDIPRKWTASELALIEETTQRSWSHIERVRSDAALRKSEARFRAAVEAVEGVVWTNDAQGRMRGEQPGWAELTGQSYDDYQDYGWTHAVHPDDVQASIDSWKQAVTQRTTFVFEHRVRRRDGAWRLFSVRAIPVLNDDGSVREWVGVHTDITELRDLTENLETRVMSEVEARSRTEEALRQSQKMEAIGQLTGGVAHDFNNMLTVIRGSSEMLRRPNLSDDKRRRYIEAIIDTSDRAAKLTSQLLSFARKQALKPEIIDVNLRVQGVGDMLRSALGAGVRLEIAPAPVDCFAEADAAQFETALINLAINARDAMEGKGDLSIDIRCNQRLPHLGDEPDSEHEYVAIEITDTGAGIAPQHLSRIFDPFFTTKEVGRGTGLGLSQVYGFVKQSGGDVQVRSDPGNGAIFTLYLPHSTKEVVAAELGESANVKAGWGRVLIVEDNQEVGDLARQILEDLGFLTVLVLNGSAALQELERAQGKFDVVFTDVVMPGMTGIELGLKIREQWPDLPVVLVSGYSDALASNHRHGFPLVRKPYSLDELSRVLQRAKSG